MNVHSEVEASVPELAVTSSGQSFDPRRERWSWRGPVHRVSISFEFCRFRAPALAASIRTLLLFIAENGSDTAVRNNYSRLKHFLQHCAPEGETIRSITQAEVLNYRASPASANGRLSAVSGLLKLWYELEIPGVTEDAFRLLQKLRLKGNAKGEAVRTQDPDYGPFTELERQAILTAMKDAQDTGVILLDTYALGIVSFGLAPRPVSIAMLKVRDLVRKSADGDRTTSFLEVPRAKQGGEPRSSFKTRKLNDEYAAILGRQATDVVRRLGKHFRDAGDIPLFPVKRRAKEEAEGYEYHYTADGISAKIAKDLENLEVVSERTGNFINICASRFRKTIGTVAAREGRSALVIADLLDHVDTQQVGVYTEANTGLIAEIDKAMAFHLAKLAQAFSGQLIPDEASALRAGDEESLVRAPEQLEAFDPVGSCGSFSFCSLNAPLACYTCRKFQPWLEAPHEAILDWLLRDRARLVEEGDLTIASVRDRTILAVAAVVLACLEEKDGKRV